MALTVEWRVREGADAIVVVDPGAQTVAEVITPDADLLKDYLAVTADLQRWRSWTGWRSVEGGDREPEAWGELVLGRTESGEVVTVDPELFWEGITRWFRSRGVDYNT